MAAAEALNAHDFHRMTEFVHDELVENVKKVTRDDIIAELQAHGDAVPDFTWRVQDVAIDGDRVAARLFNQGTHTKEWLGVAPTGNTLEFAEYSLLTSGRLTPSSALRLSMGAAVLAVAPPLRLKARPGLDVAANALAIGAAGHLAGWSLLRPLAEFPWTMAVRLVPRRAYLLGLVLWLTAGCRRWS